MENFREFEAGPDPFGRTWRAYFKYLQTAISIRHSDSVDVCYVVDNGEETVKKIVVIPHADLRAYAERTGRKISDSWCSRIAVLKLRHAIETAEDLEKEYLQVTPREIQEYDAAIQTWEEEWLKSHKAA
ncbi:MAG TPA: hypothetical protein VHB50_02995 [Bryobacteraceae bacterium]|nr:hypothetical protein [Bryobacteraceae bacterium]